LLFSFLGVSRDVEGLAPSVLPRRAGCRVGRIGAADLAVAVSPASLSLTSFAGRAGPGAG
jgi:hypothetical protein